MVLLDNAPRERETDTPSTVFRREACLEDTRANLTRNAGAVIRNTNADALWHSRRRDVDAPTAPGEGVDRVLHQHFERPLEQHGVTLNHDRLISTRRGDFHGVRERRYARAEVAADCVDELAHIHGISPRRPANALEAMRDALESVEITAHVQHCLSRERIFFALAQQLEPTAER